MPLIFFRHAATRRYADTAFADILFSMLIARFSLPFADARAASAPLPLSLAQRRRAMR